MPARPIARRPPCTAAAGHHRPHNTGCTLRGRGVADALTPAPARLAAPHPA
ncbi:hypothetical protein XCR_3055 [Xanthomonas campestris pv. raphani 756C]|nr:hypothetical protein XCR_3055 [Xanthomonas campestris pv. raphani 756C]